MCCTYLRALWAKRYSNPIEFGTLVVSALALVTAAVGGVFVYLQVKQANVTLALQAETLQSQVETLQNQAESTLDQLSMDVDKTMADKFEAAVYFQDSTKNWAGIKPELKVQVVALANYQLDFFDTYFGERENLGETADECHAWKNYITASFKTNDILCTVWKNESSQHSNGVTRMGNWICNGKVEPKDRCPKPEAQ